MSLTRRDFLAASAMAAGGGMVRFGLGGEGGVGSGKPGQDALPAGSASGVCAGGESAAPSRQPAAQTPQGASMEKTLLFQRQLPIRYTVDIFVAGGGPAGIAAAVAAARQGVRVFLAERNICFGGMGTAGMLPVFMPFGNGEHLLAAGIGSDVLKGLGVSEKEARGGGVVIQAERLKRLYDDLVLQAGVDFTFQTELTAVEAAEGRVRYAVLAAKSGLFAVEAKMFIDATGDGDLAAWAGAPFEKGDAQGRMMAGTLCSLWTDIDWKRVHEGGRIPDQSRLPQAIQDGLFSLDDRHLPGMWPLGPTTGGGNIGHTFGLDGTDERSITKAVLWARKSLLEYEQYYKKYLKGFERMQLAATASQLGVRESRRILGDYVLVLEDFQRRAVFEDEIGRFSYPVDIHAPSPGLDAFKEYEKGFTTLRYKKGESYGIPYRVLTPRGLKNVLVAGRCISTDRPMQSSIRVMPGCFLTGQAAGVAAALAVQLQTDTRSIPIPELQKRLKALGAYLPNTPG